MSGSTTVPTTERAIALMAATSSLKKAILSDVFDQSSPTKIGAESTIAVFEAQSKYFSRQDIVKKASLALPMSLLYCFMHNEFDAELAMQANRNNAHQILTDNYTKQLNLAVIAASTESLLDDCVGLKESIANAVYSVLISTESEADCLRSAESLLAEFKVVIKNYLAIWTSTTTSSYSDVILSYNYLRKLNDDAYARLVSKATQTHILDFTSAYDATKMPIAYARLEYKMYADILGSLADTTKAPALYKHSISWLFRYWARTKKSNPDGVVALDYILHRPELFELAMKMTYKDSNLNEAAFDSARTAMLTLAMSHCAYQGRDCIVKKSFRATFNALCAKLTARRRAILTEMLLSDKIDNVGG